ncbi:TetR/AcrR family transcriptional regulator [Mucilaginibacter sp. SMC90]|uniref:TetR/AcrR family transcriptional regulator n=1 Tax=Mucilaginibacter sp. SMC90 TaxID=2929803 RepID=UPI001FB20C2E|nr:TetR/AcrR family transcriptional regulator [Mucilaginibacter sp. SMC90]UOE46627.1 TetR/AcrR family transcriptional regulator [Mucilaginibacter sp. SMC90]
MNSQDDIIREEILQAGLRLYRGSGPAKITMENVAKATGRSRSSLYYYFKDKDEIFQAVLDRIAHDVAAEIRLAVTKAKDLNEKIIAFCTAKIKTSQEWKRIFNAIEGFISADEKFKHAQSLDGLHQKLIHLERGIIMDAFSAEEQFFSSKLNYAEKDMLAFIICSGVRGIRREIYDYNDPHDVNIAAQLLSDMVAKWLLS